MAKLPQPTFRQRGALEEQEQPLASDNPEPAPPQPTKAPAATPRRRKERPASLF